MPELHFPWLEVSILVPLFGAFWVHFRRNGDSARKHAIFFCVLSLGLTIGEWIDFSMLGTFEAHDHWDVIEWIFHRDIFVVDELSAPLLPLSSLIFFVVVVSTQRNKVNRFSFSLTLLSESICLATLSCRGSWILVFLLSLATLPPWIEMKRRGRCTRVYELHIGAYVTLMVVGWVWLKMGYQSGQVAFVPGALLSAATLLRSGIVPVHCWLTDLFEKATFGTAILFATPMTGAYAVMRLVLPIAPAWALQSIAIISLFTAIYAAGMALVQSESRRFFCYLFLSHASLVLVGLELVTPIGLAGALCVWLSVGLSLTGFGITLRCIEARIGRVSLGSYHGLYRQMPSLAGFFLLTGLASIGFPATVGFVGMELLVEGAVDVYPFVGFLVVIAAAMNGIAILHAYFHVFTGRRHVPTFPMTASISERVSVLILSVLIVGGGLIPQPGVHSRYHAAEILTRQRQLTTKFSEPTAAVTGHVPEQGTEQEAGGSHVTK